MADNRSSEVEPQTAKRAKQNIQVKDSPADGWVGVEYEEAGSAFTLRMNDRFHGSEKGFKYQSPVAQASCIRISMKNIRHARAKLENENNRLWHTEQLVQRHCTHQWSEWTKIGHGDDAGWTRNCSVCELQQATYDRPVRLTAEQEEMCCIKCSPRAYGQPRAVRPLSPTSGI